MVSSNMFSVSLLAVLSHSIVCVAEETTNAEYKFAQIVACYNNIIVYSYFCIYYSFSYKIKHKTCNQDSTLLWPPLFS